MKFAAAHIKKNPAITMTELKKLAKKKKINIYPLIIGLAKNTLGMGRPKRKTAKKATAARRGPGRPAGRRGPGRPRKVADPAEAISNVLAHVRDLEREVVSLRAAMVKISDLAGRH
ncbi:MAG: hypothetical protein CMJ83_09945 [Planctomycetes bacterium]|nr:hypothetical protein [Planctomycetota bacterium]